MESTMESTLPPTVATTVVREPTLEELVGAAFASLRPTTAASAGIALLEHEERERQMRACIEAAGLEFIATPLEIDAASLDDVSINPGGVDAAWWIPPDVEGARVGLGLAGPLEPPDLGGEVVGPIEVEQGYLDVQQQCDLGLVEQRVFDQELMLSLLAQMSAIGFDAMQLDGFAPLQVAYRACMQAAGFDVADPALLLDLAKERYGVSPTESAQQLERASAVADAECRGPVYAEFLALNEDAWRTWLSDHGSELAEVAAQFDDAAAHAIAAAT